MFNSITISFIRVQPVIDPEAVKQIDRDKTTEQIDATLSRNEHKGGDKGLLLNLLAVNIFFADSRVL